MIQKPQNIRILLSLRGILYSCNHSLVLTVNFSCIVEEWTLLKNYVVVESLIIVN